MTPPHDDPDSSAALDRFVRLLAIPTVSHLNAELDDAEAFERFRADLTTLYPATHAALERTVVNGSLLYRWPGAAAGAATVLMAHYDVVPAESDGWTHPPFEPTFTGAGADRVLWGRGTLDDKGSLVAILEAVERLVTAGFTPARDVYLSFGHNEESAGSGAQAVVAELRSRGVDVAFVVDEGGAIITGVLPGVSAEIAMVGVSERGILTLELAVEQQGGHASTPPRTTATVALARAITRLNARPFPTRLGEVTRAMLTTLAPHATEPYRSVFSRASALAVPLAQLFARLGDETRAMVRTTAAVTQLSGSAAPNVLAERATAVVNVRVAVGSSLDEATAHVRRAIRDDTVSIRRVHATEPSPVSPGAGPGWDDLSRAVAEIYPGTLVAPYVQLGASDSRHFTALSPRVYRFTPFRMSGDERATLHAIDERMHVDTWLRGIDFYELLLSRV